MKLIYNTLYIERLMSQNVSEVFERQKIRPNFQFSAGLVFQSVSSYLMSMTSAAGSAVSSGPELPHCACAVFFHDFALATALLRPPAFMTCPSLYGSWFA